MKRLGILKAGFLSRKGEGGFGLDGDASKDAGGPRRRARCLLAVALCIGPLLAPVPALALTSGEVAKVVDLIAALQPSLGPFAYDEEIARDWFERDAEDGGLIGAAGFTAESWETAVGETFRGLIALEPQGTIDALRAKLDLGMDSFTQLDDAQKAQLQQELEAEFTQMLALRAEGEAFADIVRPIASRLNALIQAPSD